MQLSLRWQLSTIHKVVTLLTPKCKNMPGFSNQYIQDLMYKISTEPTHFKGVYPCDIFRDEVNSKKLLLKEKNCFIINLSSSNHGGSHFVCLLVMPGKVIEYFDSFGLPLFDSNISEALTSFKVEVSTKTIQDNSSQLCGLYCITYLLWRQVGLKKNQYSALFDTEKKTGNDSTVLELVKIFVKEKNP